MPVADHDLKAWQLRSALEHAQARRRACSSLYCLYSVSSSPNGDKRALYLRTLDSYTERSKAGIAKALDPQVSLAEGLQRFYDSAIAAYLPSNDPARGCYLIGTAVTEAVGDPEIRTRLANALREFERLLEARIRKAREDGEIDAASDPRALAMIASAVLHTMAIRSRAGESRNVLRSLATTAIDLICGRAPSAKRRSRA